MSDNAYQKFLNLQRTLEAAGLPVDDRTVLLHKLSFIAYGGTEAEWDAMAEVEA